MSEIDKMSEQDRQRRIAGGLVVAILAALFAVLLAGCQTAAKYPEAVTKTPVRTITTIEPVFPYK